jgi:hypothetical protein
MFTLINVDSSGFMGNVSTKYLTFTKKRTGPPMAHHGPCAFLLKFKGEGM